jgi:hypothetical protein
MDTIINLRKELAKVFEDLRAGNLSSKNAAELNNTAGKIINSLRAELEYYKLRKEPPEIDFFKE